MKIKSAVMTGVVALLVFAADGAKAGWTSVVFRGIDSGSMLFLTFDDYAPYFQSTLSQYSGEFRYGSPVSIVWDKLSLEPGLFQELVNGQPDFGTGGFSFVAGQSNFAYSMGGQHRDSRIFFSKPVSADFEYETINVDGQSVIKSDHVANNLYYGKLVGEFRIESDSLNLGSGIDFSVDGWGGSYFTELGTRKATFKASYWWDGELDLNASWSFENVREGFRLSSGDPCNVGTQCFDRASAALIGTDFWIRNSLSEFMFIESVNGVAVIPIPEPETYAMMLAGLGMLGVVAHRRKQKLNA